MLEATRPDPTRAPYDVVAEQLPPSRRGPESVGELVARGTLASLDDPRFDRRVSTQGVVEWVVGEDAFALPGTQASEGIHLAGSDLPTGRSPVRDGSASYTNR